MLVFAHPHCPCTRATLWECAELLAEGNGRLQIQVWFYAPRDAEPNWAQGDLWNIATATPHMTAHVDRGGALATNQGALTSGHAQVYDRRGKLCFDGGLTASRGHQGNCRGTDAIEKLLGDPDSTFTTTNIYGCGITESPCKHP